MHARLPIADGLGRRQRRRHDLPHELVEEPVAATHRRVQPVEPEVGDERRVRARERPGVEVACRRTAGPASSRARSADPLSDRVVAQAVDVGDGPRMSERVGRPALQPEGRARRIERVHHRRHARRRRIVRRELAEERHHDAGRAARRHLADQRPVEGEGVVGGRRGEALVHDHDAAGPQLVQDRPGARELRLEPPGQVRRVLRSREQGVDGAPEAEADRGPRHRDADGREVVQLPDRAGEARSSRPDWGR